MSTASVRPILPEGTDRVLKVESIVGKLPSGARILHRLVGLLVVSEKKAKELLEHREQITKVQRFGNRKSVIDIVGIGLPDFKEGKKKICELISEETKKYSADTTSISTTGVNPDVNHYLLNGEYKEQFKSLLDGRVLISGVELPAPQRGYDNLDVLISTAMRRVLVSGSSIKFSKVMSEVRRRITAEINTTIHESLFDSKYSKDILAEAKFPQLFTAGPSLIVPKKTPKYPAPVSFFTIVIPDDAKIELKASTSNHGPTDAKTVSILPAILPPEPVPEAKGGKAKKTSDEKKTAKETTAVKEAKKKGSNEKKKDANAVRVSYNVPLKRLAANAKRKVQIHGKVVLLALGKAISRTVELSQELCQEDLKIVRIVTGTTKDKSRKSNILIEMEPVEGTAKAVAKTVEEGKTSGGDRKN